MQRIRTIEVRSHVGERVRAAGWLHSLRQMGGINFLVIRDGWGTLQAVAETETEIAPLVESGAGVESVLAVEGEDVLLGICAPAMAQVLAPDAPELQTLCWSARNTPPGNN